MKKKLLIGTLVTLSALTMAGCSKNDEPTPTTEPTTPPTVEPTDDVVVPVNKYKSLIDGLYVGMAEGEYPMYDVVDLDETTFESFAFTPYVEGIEAVTGDAMINAIAHSVVLVHRTDANVDLEAMAKEMEANANKAKWVCVEAEKVATVVSGDYLLFVMSSEATTDALLANFENAIVEYEANLATPEVQGEIAVEPEITEEPVAESAETPESAK